MSVHSGSDNLGDNTVADTPLESENTDNASLW